MRTWPALALLSLGTLSSCSTPRVSDERASDDVVPARREVVQDRREVVQDAAVRSPLGRPLEPSDIHPVDPTHVLTWEQITKLTGDMKYREALAATQARLELAKSNNDEADWLRALLTATQLQVGLGGFETAVNELRDQPWPQDPVYRSTVLLFYAQSLSAYLQGYLWEIRTRERTEAGPKSSPNTKHDHEIKTWTVEDIFAEIQRADEENWEVRNVLGAHTDMEVSTYIKRGEFPEGIRSTLRDVITYQRVEHLTNDEGWRPEHKNGTDRLDFEALLGASAAEPLDLLDPTVHPLVKIAAVLEDLEAWHRQEGRRGAALEAYLERIRQLDARTTDPSVKARLRKVLRDRANADRNVPWWSMSMATLATFERNAGMLVRALKTAQDGQKAHPGSMGSLICRDIVQALTGPDFFLASMAQDGPRKRSILLTHRNVERLWLRAYRIDLDDHLRRARAYNDRVSHEVAVKLLAKKPAYAWTVDLPATPDLESHQTYVTPPMTAKGLYVILASARPDFVAKNNRVVSASLWITDLALLSIVVPGEGTEVTVLDAETGAPVRDASVSFYENKYSGAPQRLSTQKTDAHGTTLFRPRRGSTGVYFAVAKARRDVVSSADLYGSSGESRHRTESCLIYTDRSIYRPLQKISWKIVAYSSAPSHLEHQIKANAPISVRLVDANGDEIEEVRAKTNAFGTASGTFFIPSGRLLGSWSIQTTGGYRSIQVEEYKRPTFEASMGDAEGELRLNRPARIKGTARYYFGLPVTSGTAKWRVTREPNYPWWMRWWGGHSSASPEVVATGTSKLDDDGAFFVDFTTTVAPPKTEDDRATTYTYRVAADVTNDAGETRTATKIVNLGWNSVMASLTPSSNVFTQQRPASFEAVRTDLNGAARPGDATWRVFALMNPDRTRMPSEVPIDERERGAAGRSATTRAEGQPMFETPGDRLRPRWLDDYAPERSVAMLANASAAEVAQGKLTHGKDGQATIKLPKLAPGAYRILYETRDERDEKYVTRREFVVAGEASTPLNLPAVLAVAESSVKVGENIHVFAHSGFLKQPMVLEFFRGGKRVSRQELEAGRTPSVITVPITEADRGGFSLTLTMMRDHQLIRLEQSVFVPWDNKELTVEFSTFRDKIRPGARETWRVKVASPRSTFAGATPRSPRDVDAASRAAELLAYMYDASLDVFAPHSAPSILDLYPSQTGTPYLRHTFGAASTMSLLEDAYSRGWPRVTFQDHQLVDLGFSGGLGLSGSGYGAGGLGIRGSVSKGHRARRQELSKSRIALTTENELSADENKFDKARSSEKGRLQMESRGSGLPPSAAAPAEPSAPLRSNFQETAFWMPYLLTAGDGSATIEFEVPDSVTTWNVFAHAMTRDLRGGSVAKTTRTVKALMVRPYLPRFLRENDRAVLKVAVDNASERVLAGTVKVDIVDLETNQSVLKDFGLDPTTSKHTFDSAPGKGMTIEVPLSTPRRPGLYAFHVTAQSGDVSDGEVRSVPVLPSRLHLVQSRFTTLKDAETKTLVFEDMAKGDDDPTRIDERLVVTLDAQLFYATLDALPYLIRYPYECVEQTLNRFVSTGIMTSLFARYPSVQHMAKQLSERGTELETWAAEDPNRKLALEETPWLNLSRGGRQDLDTMVNVLNPAVAAASRQEALGRLAKMQRPDGSFPWFPGGPASSYMTLYLLHGFARATQYKVDVPRDMVVRAWSFLADDLHRTEKASLKDPDCCLEYLTFLNYVASSFPDESWGRSALSVEARKQILDLSFKHWRELSPYVKTYLALTLHRMGRANDARLVFDSVMDASRTTDEQGTFWAPEDRSWLWYNDTIETHAFALMALLELRPDDARRHGMVQWLLMNKKLNHWKSTRATAEVIYALVKYLEQEGTLAVHEEIDVKVGPRSKRFVFVPEKYTGKNNQVVIEGAEIDPATMSKIEITKPTPGFAFASATWHFSTDTLPKEASGDFFSVSRKYFKRVQSGRETVLKPYTEGERVEVGDQVEVQLSIRAKHAAEYVHLRDPRAAGFEPEDQRAGYSWDNGIVWYQETRDSGANFFFEALPVGEYTFRYRLRATMAGAFRVGPATIQSMYAPEFAAYSSGRLVAIDDDRSR
ncbi:MAG: hypothetical protein IPK13_26990 [Deltaproteobacteria bacterium]|nr:hypothetical protein [Deltaproteobacteria bacterium]